jgi:DNA-binding CsgD family transcriptional regulator
LYSKKIIAFSDFLERSPDTYNEIAKFLVMETFSEEECFCLYIGELIDNGFVCPLGGYGWSSAEYAAFFDLPIQEKIPITAAIRDNTVLIAQNGTEFEKELFPLLADFNYEGKWVSAVAIPVFPVGGMALYSRKKLVLTDAMKVFYIAIGSLLGQYSSRLPKALVAAITADKEKIDIPHVPLSERQLVIAGFLERGFNNAQIALEIGYSESLIRQETVAIYRKLEVTGRKALQLIRALQLDSENITKEP